MNIYRIFFIILILLFLSEEYIKLDKNIYKVLKRIIFLLLIILIGYRGGIAADDKMYIELFEGFEYSFLFLKNSRYEILFLILNGIVKIFTNNYRILFLCIATISLYNLYRFINFFSISFFYSVTFYYCRWIFLKEFTQIRSGLACSFLYLAIIELYKNNTKKYIFWVIIGGLIHKSVFFGLLLPLFLNLLNKDKKIREKGFYIFILALPLINIKKYLNIFLLKYGGDFGVADVYTIGIYSERDSNITYIYSLFFLVILKIFDKKLINRFNKKYKFLKKVYIFSCFIEASLFGYGAIVGRLASFFNIEFVLQDKLLYLFKYRFFIRVFLVFLLIILYYINFTLRDELNYWNYFY